MWYCAYCGRYHTRLTPAYGFDGWKTFTKGGKWSIVKPNDDNLNDAIARKRRRR